MKIIKGLFFVCVFIFSSCEKQDTVCRFYTNGDLKYEKKTGNCYYMQGGKKVYLKRESCTWYCD